VTEIQHFMLDSVVIIFPIVSFAVASAFALFLQRLKRKGYSWGTIRQRRSAVNAFHKAIPGISAEKADPFTRFPEMSLMWSGINCTVLTSVTPRRALPGVWVIVVIRFLHQRFFLIGWPSACGSLDGREAKVINHLCPLKGQQLWVEDRPQGPPQPSTFGDFGDFGISFAATVAGRYNTFEFGDFGVSFVATVAGRYTRRGGPRLSVQGEP